MEPAVQRDGKASVIAAVSILLPAGSMTCSADPLTWYRGAQVHCGEDCRACGCVLESRARSSGIQGASGIPFALSAHES